VAFDPGAVDGVFGPRTQAAVIDGGTPAQHVSQEACPMPGDPVQQDGIWWVHQDDGTWLRWDEASGMWVDTQGAVVGPAPSATTGVAATTSVPPPVSPPQPGLPQPRSKGRLYAIVGAAVLGVVAIAVFAMSSGGSSGGNEQTARTPSTPKAAIVNTTSAPGRQLPHDDRAAALSSSSMRSLVR
jgi:hypothetical protein